MTDFSSPGWYVSVTGLSGQEERIESRILSLSFEEEEAKADKLLLRIDNFDLTQFESPIWQPGNTVQFQFGYPGFMSPRRTATIQTVKGWNPRVVEAHGKETDMNKVRGDGTQRWEQVKRSDVVRRVAQKYGFAEHEIHIEDTKLVMPQISQSTMTDLQLVRSLAEREGYEFYVDYDGLHFHPQNTNQPAVRTFTYYTDTGIGDIEEISPVDDRGPGKPGKMTAVGRNPRTKETFRVTGSDATTARTALTPERTAFGVGDEQAPPQLGESWVRRSIETTLEAAQRQEDGFYKKLQMGSQQLNLKLRGYPDTVCKTNIRLLGAGPSHSGLWYVTSAKHDISSGYRLTLKVKRDGKALGVGGAGSGAPKTTAKTKSPTNTTAPAAEGQAPAMVEVRRYNPATGTFDDHTVLVPRSSGT